jgi:hypothetical protein
MWMVTVLGTMVFMPPDGNRFCFQRINVKIKDGQFRTSGSWVTFGIVVRIFTFLVWPYYKGGHERVAWPRWVYLFRCGAHLSNLALGSSGEAQSSVGRNSVQVASRFEVFWANSSWSDAVSALTGRGPPIDRTRRSCWPESERVSVVIGRG